jgi:predicted FMN-binding regulatory protein PaiB
MQLQMLYFRRRFPENNPLFFNNIHRETLKSTLFAEKAMESTIQHQPFLINRFFREKNLRKK